MSNHTNDNDIDHLCKMLRNSHDLASKASGMTDTLFLQALDGVMYLREQVATLKARVDELEDDEL